MYNHKIEILAYSEVQDEYNQKQNDPVHVAFLYTQRTENGGRENLYASRIVHENEVIFSTRYREGITPSMLVKENGKLYDIDSIQLEGRKKYMHIKITLSDSNDKG